MRRCLVCGSDEVFLWLGGSIGLLYHCPECHYVGPVVVEGYAHGLSEGFTSFWDRLEEKTMWSETGITNNMLFQA